MLILRSLPISGERSRSSIDLQTCIHMCIIVNRKRERRQKGGKGQRREGERELRERSGRERKGEGGSSPGPITSIKFMEMYMCFMFVLENS